MGKPTQIPLEIIKVVWGWLLLVKRVPIAQKTATGLVRNHQDGWGLASAIRAGTHPTLRAPLLGGDLDSCVTVRLPNGSQEPVNLDNNYLPQNR